MTVCHLLLDMVNLRSVAGSWQGWCRPDVYRSFACTNHIVERRRFEVFWSVDSRFVDRYAIRIGFEAVPLVQSLNDAYALRPAQPLTISTCLGLRKTRIGTIGVLRRVESVFERAQDSLGNLLDGEFTDILSRIGRHFHASHIVTRSIFGERRCINLDCWNLSLEVSPTRLT